MSPVSKVRRDTHPRHPEPKKSAAAVEAARRQYRRKRVLFRTGQVLMIAAVLLALEHVAAHLGAFGSQQPPLLIDLVAGWPLAGVLLIMGAMLAGQRR
jgi:hypothetical protein